MNLLTVGRSITISAAGVKKLIHPVINYAPDVYKGKSLYLWDGGKSENLEAVWKLFLKIKHCWFQRTYAIKPISENDNYVVKSADFMSFQTASKVLFIKNSLDFNLSVNK
ncbi:MAG: hypothetical protein M3525_06280 [Acidobacteriota bacterium]|nr:hypothetical protein [Acidobacteriota bacterium]